MICCNCDYHEKLEIDDNGKEISCHGWITLVVWENEEQVRKCLCSKCADKPKILESILI